MVNFIALYRISRHDTKKYGKKDWPDRYLMRKWQPFCVCAAGSQETAERWPILTGEFGLILSILVNCFGGNADFSPAFFQRSPAGLGNAGGKPAKVAERAAVIPKITPAAASLAANRFFLVENSVDIGENCGPDLRAIAETLVKVPWCLAAVLPAFAAAAKKRPADRGENWE